MTIPLWWLSNVLEGVEDRVVEYTKLRAVRLLLVLDSRSLPVEREESFAQAISYLGSWHCRLLEEGR